MVEHERRTTDDAPSNLSSTEPAPATGEGREPAGAFAVALERFSATTQQVLMAANEQARRLRHGEIRPEHILVALLLDQRSVVTRPMLRIVGSSRDDLAALRELLLERLSSIPARDDGESRLSDGCKQVLQMALTEAVRLRGAARAEVEPIHLMVGLISEGSAVLGTPLATGLALRGLRVAVGASVWRPGMPRSLAGALADRLPLGFKVTPGEPGPTATPGSSGSAASGGAVAPGEVVTRDNVITLRVTDADLAAVDALVEAGAMRTRSEASAWLLASGIQAHQAFFDQIRAIHEEVARLRQQVQQLADEHLGRVAAPADAATQ